MTCLSRIAAPDRGSETVRIQRKCACGAMSQSGGMCKECAEEKIQRKLAIGASNDPLEAEADRIADRVLSAPETAAPSQAPISVRRFTPKQEGEQAQAPSTVDRVLQSAGHPLDTVTRNDMGRRFGHDFSRVRIHDGVEAARSARDIDAQAYTAGDHIVFGEGRYDPSTGIGRRLLAHELTHVVQQGGVADTLRAKPEDAAKLCGGSWTCAASPCDRPDPGREGDGTAPSSWTLKIMIDAEAASIKDVGISTVGHTYVEFLDSTKAASTFGFYPDKAAGTPDPYFHPAVTGCMVHPDKNHEPCIDYVETFQLSQMEFQAALTFAQAYCRSPEKYNLQSNNCTTFVQSVARIAGRTLPPIRGKVADKIDADNPYTLVEGLRRRDTGPTYTLTSDTDIRNAIANAKPEELRAIPIAERIRVIDRLLDGWVSEEDIAAIERICKFTSYDDSAALQAKFQPREKELNEEQRKRLHTALFTIGPGDFPKSAGREKAT